MKQGEFLPPKKYPYLECGYPKNVINRVRKQHLGENISFEILKEPQSQIPTERKVIAGC
jgi:hypothetical protein